VTVVTGGVVAATSDDWDGLWADYGESAEANPAQEYRRRLITTRLAPAPGARIVDIGSGQGDLAVVLAAMFPAVEIVGLELGASGIAQARLKLPSARFVQTNLLERQDPGDLEGWATHATCSEVLEHVEHPELLLANAALYLAPGSRLVVTVPAGPRTAFDRHIGHRRHFTPSSLRAVLDSAGFVTERVEAAGFPFFDLYRLVVLVRGRRLIEDVRTGNERSRLASSLLATFRALFRLNLSSTPFGWQLVAVAHRR